MITAGTRVDGIVAAFTAPFPPFGKVFRASPGSSMMTLRGEATVLVRGVFIASVELDILSKTRTPGACGWQLSPVV